MSKDQKNPHDVQKKKKKHTHTHTHTHAALEDPRRMDLWPLYRAMHRHAGARAEAKRAGATGAEPGERVVAALLELGAEVPPEARKRIDFLELGKGVKNMIVEAHTAQEKVRRDREAKAAAAKSGSSNNNKYKAL